MINLRILGMLLRKEVWLMTRNAIIPRVVVFMPVVVMLVLPLVTGLDVRDVGMAVVDEDCSLLSRRIVADMDASGSLSVRAATGTYGEALRMVEDGVADVVVVVPSGCSADVEAGRRPRLKVAANGVDAVRGALGARYTALSAAGTLARWAGERGLVRPAGAVGVVDRYNPGLDFRNYMIPALMVVLVIIVCGFLPTLNLLGEKEWGTIEAMNVTPVGRFVFVLSKLIPYWVVAVLVVTVGMLVGWLVYGLAPLGSVGCVYLAAVLFGLVMSGLGVAVANRSATVLQGIFVMFAFIMVFQLMGGLFTPVSSMPRWAQCVTYAVPPRYFIEIVRAVYLKGAGISDLWVQYLALAGFAGAFCGVAAVTYRKRG